MTNEQYMCLYLQAWGELVKNGIAGWDFSWAFGYAILGR